MEVLREALVDGTSPAPRDADDGSAFDVALATLVRHPAEV